MQKRLLSGGPANAFAARAWRSGFNNRLNLSGEIGARSTADIDNIRGKVSTILIDAHSVSFDPQQFARLEQRTVEQMRTIAGLRSAIGDVIANERGLSENHLPNLRATEFTKAALDAITRKSFGAARPAHPRNRPFG